MNKKKEASSTETTSGSTSGSSTSSSSSSGTDSSSSSDSDTSSSQISSKQSATEVKKCTNIQKSLKQNIGNGLSNGNNDKTDTKLNNRSKLIHRNLRPVSKVEIFSTDDEEPVENPGKQNKSKLSNSKSVVNNESKETCIKNSSNNVVHKSHALENKSMQKLKKKNVKNVSALKILDKSELNKKKSIFSPENSSDDLDNKVKTQVKPAKKLLVKSAVKKPLPKANQIKLTTKLQNYTPKLKSEIQSVSSEDESSSSDSSSCSDSDSSLLSKSEKKKSSKLNLNSNSDSDNDNQRSKQAVRKSTRYANVRKSKHLLGKNPFSDTDSDTESTKRSSSRSPVKRAPVSTKGNVKNKRTDVKISAGNILLKEERKCPLENCNSLGHLSGKAERHFTIEACPTYHNFPIAKCKEESIERKKREEIRKKFVETFKKYPSGTNTHEQKQYLQYIREMRTKFKFEPSEETKCTNKSKEPCLDNFVPEYDLKLFRDAQAISSEKIEDDLKSQPNTKGTKSIEMGKYEMEVWYQSPYPEDYARLPKLYICEFCLRYMKSHTVLQRHVVKCVWRHPPGEEVYRRDKISVWEVDGKRYKQYCQNLCLLAKFFLDHKTLYYDVEPFLFYIMTMYDSDGCHTVGYFSKEKNSFLNYNVSCILTLPPYQRQGYGRLLIDFSYLLTRVEGKIGSPEKPLSDLGLISYRSYWKDVLLGYLCANSSTTLSVKDISQEMAIHSYDIVSTLQALGMMKYWKGKHIILKKQDVLDEYVDRTKRRGPDLKEVDRNCLRWNPLQPNPA